jgi:hypothetical protein
MSEGAYFDQFVDRDFSGFGAHDAEELANLQKALSSGSPGRGGSPAGTGSPLRVESLEATLKTVTFKLENIKFWRAVPKKRAYNIAEEYNVLSSYGADSSPFFIEGGTARAEDAYYERKWGIVKYLGSLRVITHPMLLVRAAHGNQLAREILNGTTWTLGRMEPALFSASSSINSLQFDGLQKQIEDNATAAHIIDLRGGPITEEVVELSSQTVADNYGQMQVIFGGTRALSDLAKSVYPKERVNLPAPQDGVLGTPVTHFASQNGLVRLEPDVFLRPGGAPPTGAISGAPAAPAAPTSASAVGASLWTATPAIYYSVSAVGEDGAESLVTAVVAPVAIADAAHFVNLTITRVVGTISAYSYRIYRGTVADTTTHRFMIEVADATPGLVGAATQVVADKNYDLPGTSKAFGCFLDPEQGMAFKQLAPLMKLNLATLGASLRFMVLLYGVLVVYSPNKQILIKNIGLYTP